jgi:polar amino acid transport system substrate-binding protein
MLRRSLIISSLAALTAFAIGSTSYAAETQKSLSSESVLEAIKKRGKIKIGLSTFTPWAMRSKTGELIGFEIDVGKELAKDMKVEIEFAPTQWDGIIPALIAGNFDVIVSGMSITPQRNLSVNFTVPYANSGMHIVANKKLAPNHTTLADFNKPNYKIAVRRGATSVEDVRRFMPKAQMLQFDDEATSKQEVINGNAHAWVTSAPKPAFAALENPEVLYIPVADPFVLSAEAFAMRKGDPDALNFFNNWIESKHRSGWLKERHDYWFKAQEWKNQVAG